MSDFSTDYLVVGAGATALAFVDTLLDHTDSHITIVDRRNTVGGHWNDAYPFVKLHQPSSFYGVASCSLGNETLDTTGLNEGFEELATGNEVINYFHALLNDRFLLSGRVRFVPNCEHIEKTTVRQLQSGALENIDVRRKIVDASVCENSIPLTHAPNFDIEEHSTVVPPNSLPELADAYSQFTVLGAGKTAMDSIIWLLEQGIDAANIRWVVPRDAWIINRAFSQPSGAFYFQNYGGYARQLENLRLATSPEDLGERMEKTGLWMRLDTSITPSIVHGATLAPKELNLLRSIQDVVRLGRVTKITVDRLHLEQGELPIEPGTLFVDCTASALRKIPVEPVFQQDRIALQMIRLYQPTFSGALIARIEALDLDDRDKNTLSAPVAMTDDVTSWVESQLVTMRNQFAWSQNPTIKDWIKDCRLDGFARAGREVDRSDPKVVAVFEKIKTEALPAFANMQMLASV